MAVGRKVGLKSLLTTGNNAIKNSVTRPNVSVPTHPLSPWLHSKPRLSPPHPIPLNQLIIRKRLSPIVRPLTIPGSEVFGPPKRLGAGISSRQQKVRAPKSLIDGDGQHALAGVDVDGSIADRIFGLLDVVQQGLGGGLRSGFCGFLSLPSRISP